MTHRNARDSTPVNFEKGRKVSGIPKVFATVQTSANDSKSGNIERSANFVPRRGIAINVVITDRMSHIMSPPSTVEASATQTSWVRNEVANAVETGPIMYKVVHINIWRQKSSTDDIRVDTTTVARKITTKVNFVTML
jgi:hypothetical protein